MFLKIVENYWHYFLLKRESVAYHLPQESKRGHYIQIAFQIWGEIALFASGYCFGNRMVSRYFIQYNERPDSSRESCHVSL